MGFVWGSCIKPIKRQDLSVETFQWNASLSGLPPGSLHSFTQAEVAWGRPLFPRLRRRQRIRRVLRAPGRGARGADPLWSQDPPLGALSPAPPRPGRELGRAAGGARPPGLHSRAPGLRQLLPRDPAGPLLPPGVRAVRAYSPAEPKASASCRSRAGAGMRSCAPWAGPMTLSTLARERKASPACTWSLSGPDMIPYFSANAVISQNAINQLWVRRAPSHPLWTLGKFAFQQPLSPGSWEQARAKSHPACLQVSGRLGA